MKKTKLLGPIVLGITAIAGAMLPLVSCEPNGDDSGGGQDDPTPDPEPVIEEIEFSATNNVVLDDSRTIAQIVLSWTPTDSSIEFSNFVFTIKNLYIKAVVTAQEQTLGSLNLTITFDQTINDKYLGDLSFHYKINDKEYDKTINDIALIPTSTDIFEFDIIDDNTCALKGFVSGRDKADIVIPREWIDGDGKTYTVTTIGKEAFWRIIH